MIGVDTLDGLRKAGRVRIFGGLAMRLGKGVVCGLLLLGFSSLASDALAQNASAAQHAVSGYTDENVEHALREALGRNPALGSIEAIASRGTVTLAGEVTHYQDKMDAEAIANQLPGVRVVHNRISLNTPLVDDSELEDRLEDRLRFARADIGLTFPQIQVEAHKGIVSLTGSVKDPIEHAAALSLVGATDGVVSIKDRLSIDPVLLTDEAARLRVNKAVYRAASASGEVGIGSGLPVRASFSDGTVTLMGAVSDAKVKDDLLSRVRGADGVVSVDDEILVRSLTPAVKETAASAPCSQSKEVANAGH
jgi:osmotically-inducible protein OsmY